MSKKPFVKMSIEDLLWLNQQLQPVRTLWCECAIADPFGNKDGRELNSKLARSSFFKAKKIIEEYGAFKFEIRKSQEKTSWFVFNMHGASKRHYWGADAANEGYSKTEYQKFLESDYWQDIREYILRRDNYCCQQCGSQSILQVHHLTYEHHGLEHEYPEDLITLCRQCHEVVHNLN